MVLLPDHVQLLDVGGEKAIKLVIKDEGEGEEEGECFLFQQI